MSVRVGVLLATAVLTACFSDHAFGHASSSSSREPPNQAADHLTAQQAALIARAKQLRDRDAAVIKQMPVDYRDCVLPVLVDLFDRQGGLQRGYHLYVTVFDHDMDAHLQAALAGYGIAAYPGSAMPKWGPSWGFSPSGRPFHGVVDPGFTPYWGFSVGGITAEAPGRYSVGAGYMCGSRCGGGFLYGLKIDGKTCTITFVRGEYNF